MLLRLGSTAVVIAIVLWRTSASPIAPPIPPTIIVYPAQVTVPAPPPPPAPVVPVVTPPVVTIEDPATCPKPVDDAPIVKRVDTYMEAKHVIVASTNPYWVATWNDTDVYASRDAGKSFVKVLPGKGLVQDVAFDCFGHVFVLRDAKLGMHDASGADAWNAVPGLFIDHQIEEPGDAILGGGGPDIVILGGTSDGGDDEHRSSTHPQIFSSRDRGATWSRHPLDTFWEGARGARIREEADRTLRVMFLQPDCMTTHVWWGAAKLDRLDELVDNAGPGIGDGGTVEVYRGMEIDGRRWKRQGVDNDWAPIDGITDDAWGAPIRGDIPTLVDGNDVYRIRDGGKARKLALAVGATDVQYADRAGRVWGISCGRPVILLKDMIEQTCGSDI